MAPPMAALPLRLLLGLLLRRAMPTRRYLPPHHRPSFPPRKIPTHPRHRHPPPPCLHLSQLRPPSPSPLSSSETATTAPPTISPYTEERPDENRTLSNARWISMIIDYYRCDSPRFSPLHHSRHSRQPEEEAAPPNESTFPPKWDLHSWDVVTVVVAMMILADHCCSVHLLRLVLLVSSVGIGEGSCSTTQGGSVTSLCHHHCCCCCSGGCFFSLIWWSTLSLYKCLW
mmetsp:Transcript_23427/g.49513  ORF Transcript_23427/g.49513 Transcript_23427/m.49513 type:complete len:228 (-) Transcript_23427:22-705(-)